MKIGLIRHFKVKHKEPTNLLLTASEVIEWFAGYDLADVEHQAVDLKNINWERCFSSPLPRALTTATAIFDGEIEILNELKELAVFPLLGSNLKLPFLVWAIVIRIKSSSKNNTLSEFRNKIKTFVDEILLKEEKQTLVVSHGFVMIYLQKELKKRGFKGNGFGSPANAKIYIFEK
jgi:Histidine phosphatase superfamily (branch 1)